METYVSFLKSLGFEIAEPEPGAFGEVLQDTFINWERKIALTYAIGYDVDYLKCSKGVLTENELAKLHKLKY